MRSRLRLSRRWTSPFTTSRRTGVRRAIGLPAYERLEERTLLTPVAGVYDENVSNTNTVDSVAPASHFSATQFASDIAAAFEQNAGGVIDGSVLGSFWEFGRGRGKSLEINAAEGTNWAIGTGFSISGTGSYSSTPDGGNNFTSLEFTSIRAGGHTGTLLDEHVVKFGVTVTSTGSNYGNVMVTGRLASGGTVSASRVIDGGSQFEDTFYGLAAPTGDHFVGFRMQYDGNPAYVPLRFDDIGFITSEAAPPPLSLTISLNPISEAGGAAASIGTVTRSGDFSQPLVVHLVSSDTTEATVPATVTILAGDSFATFAINAVNDAQIDGLQNVTITASVAPAGGPLSLDPTFGTNGVATTPFEMKVNPPSGEVAVQPDGKLVIAGEDPLTGSWRISRLNADGSLDTSFGTNGVTTTQFSTSTVYPRPRIVVLQPDGKILVGGRISVSNAPALARYNANGSIDTTFGTNGIANFGVTQIGVEDVALNSDGTIMVALTVLNGTAFFKVAKFTSTGQLDTTFGPGGIRTSTVSATTASINLLANGGYIMAGSNRVAKFLASGGLDLSFGTNGVVTLNFGASAQAVGSRILADGKILLGYYIGGTGGPGDNFGAARLNANGTLDTTFNGTGLVVTDVRGFLDFPSSMVVQPDGKLILAGYSVDNLGRYDVALVRYGINGQLDTTFDGDGKFTTSLVNETVEMFMSIALDGDRLVGLGGFASDFRMARYVLPGVGATATAWLSVYDDETTTFLVDTLVDENDGNFGAGDLSLREALLIAPSGATISFATSLTGGTIVLSQGRITLPRSVTINGLGAAKLGISGDNVSSLFFISAGTSVTLRNLTLFNGFLNSVNGASLGGAIDNRGTLVIERCVFNGNHSDNFGGAISSFGSLTVNQSTFMNNSSSWGGAIHNRGGTATIDSTTFTGNTATWGGAIDNDSSTAGDGLLTVSNSSLVGNTAAWGGAIGNGSFATIIGVTISGNTGTEAAGGIDSSGTLTLINSTISGNTAGGDGGGLEISNSATLRNVTIFGNRAGTKGSNDYTGGGLRKEGATVAMHNTLIAGNVRGIGAGTIDDVRGWGNAITGFNNIIADAASTTVPTNGVDGNIVGTDWTTVIDPVLKDNGGATRTHAILRSGSAHDGGRNAQALDPAMNPLTTDQRGMPRFVGAVDIGAVELGVAPLPSLTLTYLISPPPFIESSGVGAAIGTVTRTGDLSQSLTVFLTSSDITEAIVPTSVTIAAGVASATFSIDAVDDDIHDGLQTVVITASVPATPGGGLQVDDTFGSGGVVTTSLSMNWLPPDAVIAVQSDGKILAAAEDATDGSWRLIRLNADGSFDTTFGTGGQVVTPFSGSLGAIPHKIVVQNDGKILVGGESVLGPAPGVLVARYNANGMLDTSFANFTGGTPGISNLNGTVGWVSDMAVRSDGRIVLALGGGSTFRAARLTSNGFQDSTFGSSGIRTYSGIAGYASALLLNPDSTFLLAGGDKVARFDADGIQVSSAVFGTNGVVTVDFSLSAAITEQVIGIAATPDGKIVVGYLLFIAGADNSSNFGVARLNANGSFDTTFSGDGKAIADFGGTDDVATSMTVQADGKILVAGYTEVGPSSEDMAIARFGLDGILDTTFDGDGRFTRSRTSSNERIFDLVARGQSLIAVGGWGDDIDVFRYVLPNVAVTATRNLLVFDHEHLTVTISRTSFTEGETVAKATMTITRHNSDIDEALTVQPLSLDTSEIILPANAVIAAGERSVTIEITVVDDLYVDGTKAFQIGAVATDYEGQGIDVTVADNDAGPLGTGNILVTSYEVNGGPSQIREYTVTGTLVRIFEIPETADGDLRDLTVDADGNVQVWEGVFSPLLKTLNPVTTVVNANALLPGWSTFNNVSYGGVSTFNNYVFVTDMQTAGGAATGLIRFDRNTGTSVRFADLANGFPLEFVDVAVGLDGLLYGLDSNDDVRVFDPVTLAELRTVDITQTVFPDHRTLAVNAAGEIFVGAWDGRIRKFDGATGALLATSTVTFGSLVDVEIRDDGTIIAGNWNDEFLVTDESLATVTRFTVPNVTGSAIFVSFAAPAPIFNLRPAADDGSETVAEDGALNGTVTGSDPEGSLLTFAVEFGPSNGTLVLNANGTYTYTPDANFHGTDTFTFQASDGDLASEPAAVSITVTSVNDAPTAPTPGSFTIPEHRPFTATVGTVTSTDVDGDAIRYSIVAGNDLGGFAIDAVTGLITVADESKLDYETTPQFMLTVRATEQTAAGLFADSVVTIQLTDVPAPRVTQVRFGYGELPGRWVTPEQLAGRTAPWQIRRIEITFDADVEVNGDDLLITGVIGRDYFYSAFDYDPVTHKATWTLSSSISRDRLTLNLDGDNATSDVNRGVNTAGEHLESGDVSLDLDVLFGDVDGSGTVNLIDALFQRGRNGTDDIWADIDGSGTVNLIDALLLRGRNGTTLVGL